MLRVKQKERGREQFNPRKRNIADHSGALGTLSFSTSSGEGLLLQKIPWEPLRFSSHPDPCPTFANFYHPAFVSFCFFPLSFHFLLLLHLKGPTGKIQSSPVLGQQKRECPTIGDAPPSLHPTHSRHYGFLRVPVLQWSPQSHNDKTSGVSQRLGAPPSFLHPRHSTLQLLNLLLSWPGYQRKTQDHVGKKKSSLFHVKKYKYYIIDSERKCAERKLKVQLKQTPRRAYGTEWG